MSYLTQETITKIPIIEASNPTSMTPIGATTNAPQIDRLQLRNEQGESRENRNRGQESNLEQDSKSTILRRDMTDFNHQLREAIQKVRIGPDEIEECILDGSTPFVHSIMATLIPSKFKVLPLD